MVSFVKWSPFCHHSRTIYNRMVTSYTLTSFKGDRMFGEGLECCSLYTAACPNEASKVCSANQIHNFASKMNPHKAYNRRKEQINQYLINIEITTRCKRVRY